MTEGFIRVLLADDHVLFREGITEILSEEKDIRVVGEATNGLEAIALSEREQPDVVLLDVEMPVMGAERAIGGILRVSPSSKVVILTMYDEPRLVRKLLSLGAHAYLAKSARREELVAAIRAIYNDENRTILAVSRDTVDRLEGAKKDTLSSRELEVLLLAVRPMSTSQIASYLHLSEGTVKRHLSSVYRKLGVSSRTDAAKKTLASGIITLRDLLEPDR